MKFFIVAIIMVVFGADVYAQNNTVIQLKCGETTPSECSTALNYGIWK